MSENSKITSEQEAAQKSSWWGNAYWLKDQMDPHRALGRTGRIVGSFQEFGRRHRFVVVSRDLACCLSVVAAGPGVVACLAVAIGCDMAAGDIARARRRGGLNGHLCRVRVRFRGWMMVGHHTPVLYSRN